MKIMFMLVLKLYVNLGCINQLINIILKQNNFKLTALLSRFLNNVI